MAGTLKIPGSIRQTKSSGGKLIWLAEVDMAAGLDGKRKRTRRTAHSKAEAERILRDLWLKRESESRIPAAQETLATYATWWLQNVKRGRIRESTLGDYEYRLSHWILPRFGRRRVTEISARDVETWMRELRSAGRSTKTINGARTILNQVMAHACKSGLITRNPVALTQPLKAQYGDATQVQEPWNLGETKDALKAVKNTAVDLFVTLGVAYGLRRGEALGLRWSDIDFEAGTLTINRGLKQARLLAVDGSVSIRTIEDATKTKSSRRVLPLSPIVMDALHRHQALRERMLQAAGSRWVENDLVFTSTIGTHVSPSNIRRQLQQQLVSAGVRVIRIHDMRHTAAVHALEAGVPLAAVSQALGHTDLNTTKGIYAPHVEAYSNTYASNLSELFQPMQDEIDEELSRRPDTPERLAF